jgi:serine/threonine protein kinase
MTPGNIIGGRYRLVRQLGEGAMGVVWAAVNELTSGEVALKLILRSTEDLRLRLLREARVCGGLKHRNVIEVHDVGQTEEGDPFLVMQLLSGETLAEHLKRLRRLDPPVAAQIARDVARALAAAHAAGVIHRDLKPANIFLHHEAGVDGATVKVLDFGVSKSLAMLDGLVTIDGGAIGSPAYMSPEQARADRTLDYQTDIWSLGVVLFELLTGVRPFLGDSNQVIPKIILGDIPLVSRHVRLVDPVLVSLVSRCLERDRSRRIGSATELAELLQRHVSPTQSNPGESIPAEELDAITEYPEESDESEAPTIALDPKKAPYWWRRVGPRSAGTTLTTAAADAGAVMAFPGTPVPLDDADLKTYLGPAVTTTTPQLTATVLLSSPVIAPPAKAASGWGVVLAAFTRLFAGRRGLFAFGIGVGGVALLGIGVGVYQMWSGASIAAAEAVKHERPALPARREEPVTATATAPVTTATATAKVVESPPPLPTVVVVAPPAPAEVKLPVTKIQSTAGSTKDKPKAQVNTPNKNKPSWLP